MSSKTKRNIRKIIIKSFNQNNTTKQLSMNKYIPKISFSNEMLTQTSLNTKSIRFRSQTEPNLTINDVKQIAKNNLKKGSINRNSYLNTPKKKKNENKYALKEGNTIKSKQNQILKTPQIISKKISFTEIYKLPTILKNDYNTLKLKLSHKKPKTNQLENKNNFFRQKTLNNNTNSFISKKHNDIKEMKERIIHEFIGINNNIDINIIDYNKICVKKKLKPINFINRIPSSFEIKKSEEFYKENLRQYMKDRFYIDTENKMMKKLKHTVFNHDNSLKEKIIKMKKISGFWGGLADYCIPIFSIRKFEYIKERLKRNKSEGNKIDSNLEGNEQKEKFDRKTSRLFTINSFLDYKHQKNLEIKKEFVEKYNDKLEYYLI